MDEKTTAVWMPEPGIYRGISAQKYHTCPYASNSKLGYLVPPSTPAHLSAYLQEPPKEKKVWKEGRILHACVLEFERYEREYRVAQQCIGTTKKGEQCKKLGAMPVRGGGDACDTHEADFAEDPDVLLVKPNDDAMARRARASFASHPIAGGFLRAPDAETELTIIWRDPVTGVMCKARVDWYSPTIFGGLPMDLKGARSAAEDEFTKQAINNGYLRQSVLYRRGLHAVGLPATTFAGVAVEKEPPFELNVYLIGDEATGVIAGTGEDQILVDRLVTALLRLWDQCQRSGLFPGYERRVHTMTTPEWAWSMIEAQTHRIEQALEAMEAAA